MFKNTIVLRAFLYQISNKLKKLKTNFEDKSFIKKISKPELTNSILEDEKNRIEESGTSDDEYLPDLRKLQPYIYKPVFQKSPWKKANQEKNHQIRENTAVEVEILSDVFVVNANQRLLMQKIFATLIKKKFPESYFKGIISFVLEIVLSSNMLVRSK